MHVFTMYVIIAYRLRIPMQKSGTVSGNLRLDANYMLLLYVVIYYGGIPIFRKPKRNHVMVLTTIMLLHSKHTMNYALMY